ncbi:MAG: hypothetical protein II800_06145, partial [Lachnospiraceae bacterium]|nr:hypothetical protein [Lachnospiraceae bacterium]
TGDGYARFGSYWGQGEVPADAVFIAAGSSGKEIRMESHNRAFWPDGSLKWAMHVADAAGLGESFTITAEDRSSESRIETGDDTVEVEETEEAFLVKNGVLRVRILKKGECLFSVEKTEDKGGYAVRDACSRLLLEHPKGFTKDGIPAASEVEEFRGRTDEVTCVSSGMLSAVFRIAGVHVSQTDSHEQIPFTIFLEIYAGSRELRITYTWFYDGDENRDFLKGIGICMEAPLEGSFYNRHIKFGTDHGYFSEAEALLLSWHPRVPAEIYGAQTQGHFLHPSPEEQEQIYSRVENSIPIWGEYVLWQDSPSHFVIRKKVSDPECCYVEGLHGNRAPGILAFGGENGGLAVSLRDFWQKYPAALRVKGMDGENAASEVWFYAPWQEAYDFRHYAKRGYSQVYYEGYDELGASPYGIASTSEFSLLLFDGELPADETLDAFSRRVQKPPVYVADPVYYHERRAFGYWSLVKRDTPAERFLEDALDEIAQFYLRETEQRNWYGLFNYGDFMHTYDPARHVWRYDMGGYAWDNTELVPTLWLWYFFLRTGREDIFSLAEALSRHTSEVDIYHFGPLQGLGSRHNVRHWGCPCKEPRIAMAGHHRFLYYLTGDYRLGDVFEEVRDADFSTLNMDPLRSFFDRGQMVYPTHARSGPDWSSYNSNWMTAWERTGDKKWRDKIMTGIEDLYATPMKLVSGSDFEYDPESSHLRYIGDRATGGSHLQICQGAEQTWLELTDLLHDERWDRMLADYGVFYPLSNEEQNRLTDGRIRKREFSYPFMAGGVIAYGAYYHKDHAMGRRVWEIMMEGLQDGGNGSILERQSVADAGNREQLDEMPQLSTNVAAQWSLNTIVALEFARDDLPEVLS